MVLTTVINFMGGPGVGKTTLACDMFVFMKRKGCSCEYVSEYAKQLVWANDFNKLNNQYLVSDKQYRKLKCLQGKVQYIITDSPLFLGLYYNKTNPDNVSNIDKTQEMILSRLNEFNNINFLISRQTVYQHEGRLQSQEEAIQVDLGLIELLHEHHMRHVEIKQNAPLEEMFNLM